MQEFIGAALGIHLSLTGMSSVLNGLSTLGKNLRMGRDEALAFGKQLGLSGKDALALAGHFNDDLAASIEKAKVGLKALAAEAVLVGAALFKAGDDETIRLTLQGVTQDSELAWRQIRFVREEFDKGIFSKSDIGEAVQMFDQAHASITSLFPLTEELALRSRKSLTAVSQYVTELAGGATARLQGLLKPAGITVDQLRAAGLNIDEHYQTKDSAAKIIAALKQVTSKGSISESLGGSFMNEYRQDLAAIAELLRSIGQALLPIATPILKFFGAVIKAVTFINDLTRGWASNIVLAVIAFRSIQSILPILAALADLLKLTAAWEAVVAALGGNWGALAAGIAVAAVVGVGWAFGPHQSEGGGNDVNPTGGSAERPQRRSSWENIYRKRQGFMQGG